MAEQTISPPQVTEARNIETPLHVTADEYMERYAHDYYEWVNGELQKMSPVTGRHNELESYFLILLETYLGLKKIGILRHSPFVMRIDSINVRRQPDLQIILNESLAQLSETAMTGPADICIEIVSPESVARDYGTKFEEYEKGGVKEYWIIDPKRTHTRFLRLNEQGVYQSIETDEEGFYQTPLLPRLRLHVPTLWSESLPISVEIVAAVQEMLKE